MTTVIGTAGHIDHGKTMLLRALTGIDADRLPEEQRRGMTIDVGYAYMTLPDGRLLDFVDVPGHDRLVGNMLVGAGEVDAVLLVVAADDGPRAQTIEHLDLIDGLGIGRGIVAITKIDLVDDGQVAAVQVRIRSLLGATRLAGAPVVRVSGTTGEGIDTLTAELASQAMSIDEAPGDRDDDGESKARLAIDRVFSVKGRGAVVTGTLRGSISRGARLRLIPDDREIVAREVQVHGREVEVAQAGRTALNLRGIETVDLHRGMVLTNDRRVVATDRLLVALHPPAAFGGRARDLPADRARLRLHLGTDQVDASVGRAGRESTILADGRATALVRLERPIAAATGDRFVLRRPATHVTEGGGVVLDSQPPVGVARRRVTPDRLTALANAGSSAGREAALIDLHGIRVGARVPALADDLTERLRAAAIDRVRQHHADNPREVGIPAAGLRMELAANLRRLVGAPRHVLGDTVGPIVEGLIADGVVATDGDRVRLPDHRPAAVPGLAEAMDRLEATLAVASPPPLSAAMQVAGCPADGLRALERDGRIVRLGEDLAWSAETYWHLARQALRLADLGAVTPAALRDATGTSRKYVMPILEDLDRRGILRRTSAGHMPGPRAASLEAEAASARPVAR